MNTKINPYRKKKEKILNDMKKIDEDREKLDEREFNLCLKWNDLKKECPHENTKTRSVESLGSTLEYTNCTDCGATLNTTEVNTEEKTDTLWNSLRKKFWGRKN
jgi:ferredoxin-like protein FixX